MWNIGYRSVKIKYLCFFSCTICKQWEKHKNTMKNFSSTWISHGSEKVAKDSIEKHVQCKKREDHWSCTMKSSSWCCISQTRCTEDIKTTDSIGLQATDEQAFKRIGISLLSDKLVGLNINDPSVNMGH